MTTCCVVIAIETLIIHVLTSVLNVVGSYPASLRNVGGYTQVLVRALYNDQRGTWSLPPPVKLERRHMTYTVSVWRKTQSNKRSWEAMEPRKASRESMESRKASRESMESRKASRMSMESRKAIFNSVIRKSKYKYKHT
jgi:hypothetical protein